MSDSASDDEGLSQSDSQCKWQGITQLDCGESDAESDSNTSAADYPAEEQPKPPSEHLKGFPFSLELSQYLEISQKVDTFLHI